jgi:gliding motility-associated-like protein
LSYTANGCTATTIATVTVIQNPTASVNPQTICFGDTVVLVGGPNGATYSWTGNNIIGPTNLQQIQVNPSSTTTYTVTTQIGGCATSSTTALVTVNPIPTVDAAPETQSICNGEIATISSTVSPGGGTYQWQGSTVNGQSTATISVNPVLVNPTATENFQYILTYSVNGCTGLKDTVEVEVKPQPVISVNDLIICSGISDTIEANPNILGGTYYWSTGFTGNTDTLLIVSPPANPIDQITNYYYDSWYILNGCSSDTVVSHVTVNPIPTVIVNDATICANLSATLTATPSSTGGSFAWSGPTISSSAPTTQSITVSPALDNPVISQNFVYSVSYTDLGCTSAPVPSNVTVNPTPSIQPISEIICSGGSFDTIPNPTALGNIIPAGTTYTWTYANNPDILNEANNSISSTTISGGPLTSNVNVSTAVNYTVTPTSGTAGNCVGTPFNLNVTITATPTIANKIDAICSGSFPVVSFIPTDVVPPGTQYAWEILFDNPLISGQSNQSTFVGDFSNQILLNNDPLAQAQTLTYLVTPKSGPCDGATFQFQVTVLPAPILADNTITICSDDNITNYTFGTPGDIIPAGTNYTWVVIPTGVVTGEQSNAVPAPTFSTALLHNTTNVDQTVHYVVTPIASALNPPCVGQSFDLFVLVKPTPVLQNITLAPICSGTSFSYSPTDASPTTIWPINGSFTWTVATNVNVSGQSDNSGTPLSTLSQTLTNLSNVAQNVIYTISPIDTLSGCNGANYTVTVPVNPRPQIPNQLLSICSGLSFTFNPSNAAPAVIVPIGTTYTWPTPIDNPLGSISGESAGNNQPSISQTLTNINSIICDTMFYTVTPSVGTAPGLVCVGNPFVLAVSVKPVPAVTVQTPSTLICPNTCIQLTATPSHPIDCNGNQGTYSWSPAATLTPTPPNTAVVTACPAGNTTYNVTYNLDGCTANASVSINVVNPPNVGTISALEQTICEGGCTVLTANIQNQNIVPEYVEWSNGELDYTSPFTIVVCPTDTLTYTATAYLAGCFGNSASTTVNVNYDPVITTQPNADTTICVGGTYPLSVNLQFGAGTANYQWYISNNGSNIGGTMIPGASGTVVTNTSGYSILFSPQIFNTPGTYTYYCIITYGPNGCGSLTTAVANIHVIADPIVSILPNTTQNLCVGGTTTCLNTSVSGGIGTNYYLWNPGGASTSTFCPPSDSSGTFNYSVTVSQSGIACASLPSNVVVINIVPDPIITISGEIEVCDGAEVPLTTSVTGGIGNITSYTWNQSQPVGSPYSLMSWTSAGSTTVEIFDDITYQVEITQEGNGCNALDTHYIHVVPDPIVTVDFEELVCVNTPTVLTANITGGTGIAYFDWYQVDSLLTVGGTPIPTDGPSDNSITQTIYESYYNFYYVALEMTGLGCDLDTSDLVIIEALDWAIANFDVLPDSLEQSFLDPTFSFLNQSEHATNYWWDLDECAPQLPNSSLYQIPTSYYNPTSENIIDYTYGCEPGIYTVQLIAYNQGICPDTAWQQIAIRDVLIVYVPNTFTPNGDGINDIFIPVITHYDELAYYSFEIYDRWGEVIFSTDNSEQGWDGIAGRPWPFMEGTQSPPNKLDQSPQDGTYTWTLKARLKNSSDIVNERGHVNILR